MSKQPLSSQRTVLLQRAYARLLAERWLNRLGGRLTAWLKLQLQWPDEEASEETFDGKA